MSAGLIETLDAMAGRSVLVIGEAMLDRYLHGRADRLSREAPVPVVSLESRVDAPGGAANSAVNLCALGARVSLLSVVGDDDDGDSLRRAIRSAGVDDGSILVARGRRTLAKQRVIAGNQCLLRFDSGTTDPLPADLEDALIERVGTLARDVDAILVSDYDYGVLAPRVISAIRDAARATSPVIVVDARDPARHARLEPTATKPNYAEAVRLLGEQEVDGSDARARQIVAGADVLHRRTGAQIVAVTLDREGAIILERGRPPYRTYARPTADQQACGAGDTYSGTLTLALATGAAIPVAAELAAAAAAVVVAKDGTAICSLADLAAAVGRTEKRLQDVAALRDRVEVLRGQNRRIVFTNGCFDLLHRGHVTYLSRAKALGDVLVVAVNSDESIRGLKGPDRPINRLEDRLSVLEALSCVDHVVPFDAPTPEDLVAAARPDVYVKGGDYRRETLPEAPIVEAYGGAVRILPFVEDYSTTGLIERVRAADAAEASGAEAARYRRRTDHGTRRAVFRGSRRREDGALVAVSPGPLAGAGGRRGERRS